LIISITGDQTLKKDQEDQSLTLGCTQIDHRIDQLFASLNTTNITPPIPQKI
jgi:hypothetical protein